MPSSLYGLIGYPLGHSFSQNYFNSKFEAENIDAKYINFEIDNIDRFRDVLDKHPNLCGLNVTIPYKQQVISYIDELDDTAAQIGAVNVVKFIRRGNSLRLRGYNSDVIGFVDSLRPMLKPVHKRALVLGTGGASKAICYGLSTLGIEPQLVSRSPRGNAILYEQLDPAVIDDHKVIVNTTPLGMYPNVNECPQIPYYALTPEHICYDLLYNPDVTLFMKKAAERGAQTKNGLEMLLLQAFAAWQIWQAPI